MRTQAEGRNLATGEAVRVFMEDGRISGTEPLPPRHAAEESAGRSLPWIGPGLVDLQINGLAGIDFNTPPVREEDVLRVARILWREGVTSFYPTVITNDEARIEETVGAIGRACAVDDAAAGSIAGIHLEGPFIARQDGPRGAHGKAFVRAPDWELFQRWQQAAGGRIRIVTLSPEYDEAPAFIERCVRSGVTVSIGHTAADSRQIERAVQAGATMSTHLGNGAHPVLPRHPNYIWDQLAEDRLAPCVIADGFHLPRSVLKVFLRAKADQIMLASDAVYLSGMEPGEYETHIGGRVVLTQEGRLHLADRPELLAGSAQTLRAGIAYLASQGLCSLPAAWEMASSRPAALMNLPVAEGLSKGAPGDLVVFDWEQGRLIFRQVYKAGRCVYSS